MKLVLKATNMHDVLALAQVIPAAALYRKMLDDGEIDLMGEPVEAEDVAEQPSVEQPTVEQPTVEQPKPKRTRKKANPVVEQVDYPAQPAQPAQPATTISSQFDVEWVDTGAYDKDNVYFKYLATRQPVDGFTPVAVTYAECKPFIVKDIEKLRAMLLKFASDFNVYRNTMAEFGLGVKNLFASMPSEHLYAFAYKLLKNNGVETDNLEQYIENFSA